MIAVKRGSPWPSHFVQHSWSGLPLRVARWCVALLFALTATSWANEPPVCADASRTVSARSGGRIPVSCSDPEGAPLKLSLVAAPEHAMTKEMVQELNDDPPASTALAIPYAPDGGYVGTDTFSYRANDGVVDSNVATVSVTVTGPPYRDSDGDEVWDGIDNCPLKRGSREFEGCPAPAALRFFFEYWCGTHTRFDYVFWPHGHAGAGTPSVSTGVKYLFPHDPPMVANPTTTQVSLWPAGSGFHDDAWAVYTDAGAAAVPATRRGACEFAGPSPHFTTHEWLGVQNATKTTRPTALRCEFRRARGYRYIPGYVGVWGTRNEGDRVRVTHVVANEISGFGRRRHNRTFLRADVSGGKPTLHYDPSRCKRIPLPAD